jgi:hypothetical protein
MNTYTITFNDGKVVEHKADWFDFSSDAFATAQFWKQEAGHANRGELIAAFTGVQSVVIKEE